MYSYDDLMNAIGYEIDKIFYDKAKKRLSDYMSQVSLFDYIGR